MSRKFQVPIDLVKNEILNALFQKLSGDPSSPIEAQFYYHTADKQLKLHNGTSFVNVGVIDHGLLTGLADDDHSQYHNDSRALTWLGTRSTNDLPEVTNLYYTDTRVRANRLDQLAAPTGSLSLNSQKITNLLAGTANNDAVNFSQLEQARQGIRSKPPVEAVSNSNILLSNPGTDTFDSVAIANGESLLLINQTVPSENGIYVFNGSGVALTRRDDADVFAELDGGAETFAQNGSVYGSKVLRQLAEITSFSGQDWQIIGAGTTYTAGNGLTESPAGTFNVGSSARIAVNANDIDLALAGTAGTYSRVTTDAYGRIISGESDTYATNVGDNSATAIVITHNFNTRDVQVQVYLATTPWDTQECDVERTSVNTVTLRFSVAPGTDAYRVVIKR